jgi:hypothetical protein
MIGDVVVVYNGEDHEVDFDKIRTFEDVLRLDKTKPNILLHTKPQLFSAFRTKASNSIDTYVSVGDRVVYKNNAVSPIKGNPPQLVVGLELKSLGDMAVVVAMFESQDYALANHLKKV